MAGTWKALAHQPPFNASTMLLLTDGTIMCQESGGVKWWKLTPDSHGDYINGTWSPLAPMHHTRLYYASAVLADGRVFIGEHVEQGLQRRLAVKCPHLPDFTNFGCRGRAGLGIRTLQVLDVLGDLFFLARGCNTGDQAERAERGQ